MRVKTSPFHCPSYCFSNPPPPPSPPQTPPPPPPPVQCQPHALETEVSPRHTFCKSSPGSLLVEEKSCDGKVEIGENGVDGREREFILKSSLKKTCTSASKDIVRECVKWMDEQGEELVEIREFEPIESVLVENQRDSSSWLHVRNHASKLLEISCRKEVSTISSQNLMRREKSLRESEVQVFNLVNAS